MTDEATPFTFGKGEVFGEGTDVTVIACGVMVYEALRAREVDGAKGVSVRVVNLHTIKPLDRATHRALRARDRRDRHRRGAPGERRARRRGRRGRRAERIPCRWRWSRCTTASASRGKPAELMAAFGLKEQDVVAAIERVLARKAQRRGPLDANPRLGYVSGLPRGSGGIGRRAGFRYL